MPTATATRPAGKRGPAKRFAHKIDLNLTAEQYEMLQIVSAETGPAVMELIRQAIDSSKGRWRQEVAVARARVQREEHKGACGGPMQCVCTCPMCASHVMAVG